MITLQTKPERWLCQATSWAMACDVNVGLFIETIGHDGSAIGWPHLPPPQNRVGHHVQECAAAARYWGFIPSPIEVHPRSISKLGETPREITELVKTPVEEYVKNAIENQRGVIQGITPMGRGHAVAFENGQVFDPDGRTYYINFLDIKPLQIWTLHEQ